LSKSRFMAGRHCLKRLYLECYRRDLMAPPDMVQSLLSRMGNRLGAFARECFPGGVLIHEDYLHHERAAEHTRRAMAEPGVPALFEAAFTHDGIAVRVDALVRADGDTWDLVEVKSGVGLKEHQIWDAAVQRRVLTGCGVSIRRTGVMHLDGSYIFPGGTPDPKLLFVTEDISRQAEELDGAVEGAVARMRAVLAEASAPAVRPGRHCRRPYRCPFEAHCFADAPAYPVWQLPEAVPELLTRLRDEDIEDISQIPTGFAGLSALQIRARDCVLSGGLYLDAGAADSLAGLQRPLHFLDFESFSPAVPLFPDTRPYEQLAFQFSDHVLEADGTVRHQEYLHPPGGDPREAVATALLDALADRGSVLVYSSSERTTVTRLAAHLPRLRAPLQALPPRMVDLLPLVRKNMYHADLRGSFSIKGVSRAVTPSLDYGDLDIAEGTAASFSYENLAQGLVGPSEAETTLAALRSYCARDTLAMLEVYRRLRGAA
jgi:hypothetical protein